MPNSSLALGAVILIRLTARPDPPVTPVLRFTLSVPSREETCRSAYAARLARLPTQPVDVIGARWMGLDIDCTAGRSAYDMSNVAWIALWAFHTIDVRVSG